MRGGRWADGRPPFSSVFTVIPPNGASCITGWNESGQALSTVGSRHQGGAHVLMTDGAVKFITDSIEAGDQTADPLRSGLPSPYGLWGLLGTRAAKEVVDFDF